MRHPVGGVAVTGACRSFCGARPARACGGRSAFTPRCGRARKGGKPAALARWAASSGGAPRRSGAHTCSLARHQQRCGLSRRRRVDMLCLRFVTQTRQPRRRQVCARRDALSSWHEVRRPLPHRPGPFTHARDCWRRSAAPHAPAAPSCRRHTGAPQRCVLSQTT